MHTDMSPAVLLRFWLLLHWPSQHPVSFTKLRLALQSEPPMVECPCRKSSSLPVACRTPPDRMN